MDKNMIPYALMIAMVVSHTVAIQALKKKRKTLDDVTPNGALQTRKVNTAITMLYVSIPIMTAFIWFVLAPMLPHTAQ